MMEWKEIYPGKVWGNGDEFKITFNGKFHLLKYNPEDMEFQTIKNLNASTIEDAILESNKTA